MDRSRMASCAIVAGVIVSLAVTGCTDTPQVDDKRPLPTASATGALVCGFVSSDSLSLALGTSDFDATGEKRDAAGSRGKNPDSSTLGWAVCDLRTAEVSGDRALVVSVQPLGLVPRSDEVVPRVLAAGGAQYVFPASDGEGFATSDQVVYSGAGVSHLIRGDWHYTVAIQKAAKGRNAVDDAVALTRQVVATLGLPKVGTKPRPTVSAAK